MKYTNTCPSSWTLISVASLFLTLKKVILVMFMLFGAINLSMAQWTQLTPDVIEWFRGVDFINADTGFIVSDSGKILKTTNGGISWQEKNSPTTKKLKKIQIINEKFAYIVGDSAILKTTDGGETWRNIIPQHDYFIRSDYSCNGLYFINENVGYVYASYFVLKTIDGGNSWTVKDVGMGSVFGNAIYFVDENIGFIVSSHGKILKTTNGGTSWQEKNSTVSTLLVDVFFPSDSIGYICGNEGTILKTTDGGETWLNINSVFLYSLISIYFIDENNGYISGGNQIAKTTDGGVSWSFCPAFAWIYDIVFVNNDIGYAVSNGGLVKTTNGGICSDLIAEDINLYPNPAKDLVTIETSESVVNVQCYNVSGQLLLETHDKVLNLNDLSQGTYLIKVSTDKNFFIKKLILQ